MIFVFESSNSMLYSCPDSYIFDQKMQTVEWGDRLIIHPVYRKGNPVMSGYQTIQVMFSHEGNCGSSIFSSWSSVNKKERWYEMIMFGNKTLKVDMDKIVMFDLGPRHPKYFYTKDDLTWYITEIYPLDMVHINK